MTAALVVHVDRVERRALQLRGNQDDGQAWGQPPHYLLAVRAPHRPRDDQPLNATLKHQLKVGALVRGGILLATPNDKVEPMASGFRLRTGHELAANLV